MFTKLLRDLSNVYKGNELYIPDALYPLITDWLCKKFGKDPRQVMGYKWKGKVLLSYDEDKHLAAYQATPIHLPERILEKSIVIEASLEHTVVEEQPVKERPVKPPAPRRASTYKPVNRRPSFK